MLLGIVGKPSSGKSTFLNAACLSNADVSELPFTTIDPNKGIAYAKVKCVCQELDVEDDPQNSLCVNKYRFIPIKLLDVAGLVPDAHKGKGLGNRFLNDLIPADALVHIVDITGSLDKTGKRIGPGQQNPLDDIKFLEDEIDLWFKQILQREDWDKFTRTFQREKKRFITELHQRVSGLKISKKQIQISLKESKLEGKNPTDWNDRDLLNFSRNLRKNSKPIIIVANKIDKDIGVKNYRKLLDEYSGKVIPTSALAEFLLREYDEKGILSYVTGEDDYDVLAVEKLSEKEKQTLEKIKKRILNPFGGTGVQEALNYVVFDVLNKICVYPVFDVNTYSDKSGNVLPDVFLVDEGTRLREFVKTKIHSDLAEHFLFGIDARSKRRLGEDYLLKNNDVIKIVTSK